MAERLTCVVFLAALSPCFAHVRMLHNGMAVRNANGPTSDGGASVDGACGGANTWGANGFSTIEDGATVDLVWNYAAGHESAANLMYVAYSCDGTTSNDLAATAKRLLTGVTTGGGCNEAYPCPGPDAVVNGGYTFAATLPNMIDGAAVTEDTECTISILDQRDWGGCIDVKLSAAEVIPPPPAPPTPAPMGWYRMLPQNTLDNSAASFSCCNFSVGLISVPSYDAATDTSFDAFLDGRLEHCRSSSGDPTAAGAQNEYDAVWVYEDWKIRFVAVADTPSKFTATVPLLGQTYQFDVEPDGVGGGVVNFFHTPPGADEQPIACDGFASTASYVAANPDSANKPAIDLDIASATNGNVVGGGGSSAVLVVVIVAIVLVLLAGAAYVKSNRSGGSKRGTPSAKPMFAGGQQDMAMMSVVPPPPGPDTLSSSLPPGWQMATDPNTGHPYYVNTATGQSQWTAPTGGPPPPPPY